MLWQLSIKNLAIIDDVSIEFTDGFNVLTGETGAGKSIIIDAINLIIGARADRELIRTGESQATVEAIFTLDDNRELIDTLCELDFIDPEDTELLITRVIYANGRQVIRVNGRAVVASVLKDIAQMLIDIHGQHQHQSLLNKAYHMDYLDNFNQGIKLLKEDVSSLYSQWRELKRKIEELDANSADFERNKELMEYQINEIDEASLTVGEDDELYEQKQILKNAQSIILAIETAYNYLNSGKQSGDGAIDLLYSTKEKLSQISDYSEEYQELYDTADNLYYELDDLSDSLAKALRRISFSPEQAQEIDDRLYLINSLKRKYGKTIQAILAFRNNLAEQLEQMQFNMDNSEELHRQERIAHKALLSAADKLHEAREQAAQALKNKIIDELSYLGMKKVSFEAVITADKDDISSTGYDDVEFFISPNAGESLKPLAKIASGGEVSRIMLSIKSALADIDGIPTMIFDEIDTGISGAVAGAAGKKMLGLSAKHQIICITHQAQIAALADNHYFVSKSSESGKTKTRVDVLTQEQRVEHIAQMISGSTVTEAAKEHAKELMAGKI